MELLKVFVVLVNISPALVAISPVLVAYDHGKMALWVLEVDHKGVDAGIGASWFADKLELAGYAGVEITLKSDGEPSIVAFKRAVALRRQGETSMIETPVRE